MTTTTAATRRKTTIITTAVTTTIAIQKSFIQGDAATRDVFKHNACFTQPSGCPACVQHAKTSGKQCTACRGASPGMLSCTACSGTSACMMVPKNGAVVHASVWAPKRSWRREAILCPRPWSARHRSRSLPSSALQSPKTRRVLPRYNEKTSARATGNAPAVSGVRLLTALVTQLLPAPRQIVKTVMTMKDPVDDCPRAPFATTVESI